MYTASKKRKLSEEDDDCSDAILARNITRLSEIEREIRSLFPDTIPGSTLSDEPPKALEKAEQMLGKVFLEQSKLFPIAVWQVITIHHASIGRPDFDIPTKWCEKAVMAPKSRTRGIYFAYSDALKRAMHLKDSGLKMGKVEDMEWLSREYDRQLESMSEYFEVVAWNGYYDNGNSAPRRIIQSFVALCAT